MLRHAWRGANFVLALLFLFAVAVQYNDPDPLPWMAIYAGAALASALAALGRPRRWAAALVSLVALVWALLWRMAMDTGLAPIATLFDDFEMYDAQVEETREILGLLIVTAWCAIIALCPKGRARARRVDGG